MTPKERAREFVIVGFRDLGVPSLEPYITIIAELIEGAERDAVEKCARAVDALRFKDEETAQVGSVGAGYAMSGYRQGLEHATAAIRALKSDS